MADGVNELTNMLREGMYEKYIVLEAGKEFWLVGNNEGVIIPIGANLEAYDVSELADNPTLATVKRGDLVVGEEAPAMMVDKTGLYHVVLDLHLDDDLMRPQIVIADVQWGVRGAMNGWGFTAFDEVEVDANSMTWTMENVEMPANGEFKFAYGSGWKLQLDDAGSVKANTCLGMYSQPNGANIKVDKDGLYTITLTYTLNSGSVADSYTFTTMCTQESPLPTELYMIGQDFGYWDWASDGVVAMIPVHSQAGAFWTTRYFTAGVGFKFCPQREWNGDFSSLDNNYGYIEDGNCYVEEDGFYTIYVDLANSVIAVEPAAVYGMGECFGGWDVDVEANKFVAEGTTLVSPVTVAEGNIRMYAAAPSVIEGVDWWQMEFNVYDGIIVYRGAGSDQEPVSVPEGYQVTLDLNAGIGSIAEPGVEQAYLQEISYTEYNNDTIFMSASAGRTNTYGHVQCSHPWTVASDADWLLARVNESDIYDGAFSGEHAYENIFMLYASANETDQERVGHVTISTEQNVSKTFVVVQRPYTLSFNEEAYRNDLRFDGEPVDTFVIEGAWDWTNVYYNLLPNHGVEVTSYPDWMVQDGYEFGGEACSFDNILAAEDILNAGIPIATTVSFSFERNESPEPREAHIVFEGNGQKAVGIFRQEGCNEQAIINQAGTLAKRLYLFDEALGMRRHEDFGFPSLMLTMDGRGMDLVSDYGGYNWFGYSLDYRDLGSNLIYTAMYWTSMYNHIHASNEVIHAYGDRADQSIFQFYLGQAYAFRAFNYFYLAQLYQQTYVGNEDAPCVPIISEENMDAVSDEGCPRATVREVYDFILSDLAKSLDLLEQTEIVRPGKHLVSPEVIYGLRARINMVRGEWQAAAEDARRVIDAGVSTPYTMDEVSRPTFNDINHAAWLWGIDAAEDDSPVVTGICNWPSHMGSFSSGYAQVGTWRKVSQSLYEAIPTSDVRKGWFLNANTESANLSAEQAKYVAEYSMPAYTQVKFAPYNDELGVETNASDIPLLRIEEMYLILAEAQAMLGNAAEAVATLNAFVSTYRDPEYSCSAEASVEELLDAIWMQRRIELWGEGHSYFDLMRMKKGVDRRGAGFQPEFVYNIAAGDAALIYPIPDGEMAANAQLVQNPVAEQPQAVASGAGTSSGLYMIGQDFGNWDWASDGVVAMTPVHSNEGAFWTTRYLTAGNGFKFCTQREWNGDFFSLDNNYGFTMDGGNCYVEEDGFYTIYVDLTNSVIAVEPAAVYGIGDCFGGWDVDVEENKFVAQGDQLVSPVFVADGEVRMYVAPPSVIPGFDWWKMEFNVYDGTIVYRGADTDQERVNGLAGQKVTLNLNAGTGSIGESEVEQAVSTLKLFLSVEDGWGGDFVMPVSTEETEDTEDTGNAEVGADTIRYIVRMWPVDDAAAWTEQVYYSTSPDGYIEVDTTLAEGTWAVAVWADRLYGTDSPHYSFEGALVRANTENYVGATDAKDGFCYYEEVKLYEYEVAVREMVLYRPLAKCEYVAMDMEDFLLNEAERLGLESPSDVVLEDYTVRVSYEGFLPIEYDRATLRNTDSATGVSYECGITMLDDGTALLASDYILCEQSQTLVSFHIAVMYEDGTIVYQKDLQHVPLKSNYCTQIK